MTRAGMLSCTCGGCGLTLRVPRRLAGKKGRCPSCGGVISIPVPTNQDRNTAPTLDMPIPVGSPDEVPVPADDPVKLPTVPGYTILTELGRGGMGVVYKARQENLNRVVAVKAVSLGRKSDANLLARLEKEARAVAQLRHPNIVVAFDFSRHDGRLYFIMELLEGEELTARLDRDGPLDEATAWALARQTASGLAHAHQHGIVHRDIKPSNLFLIDPPAGYPLPPGVPLVKITDFGLVLLAGDGQVSDRLTANQTLLGTPQYMAPEQFAGSDVDHRADVYALGATVHHMLSGHAPFPGKSVWEIMTEKAGESPPPPPASVSTGTRELLAAMMVRDQDRRIGDYRELMERIDALSLNRDRTAAPAAMVPTVVMSPPTHVGMEPERPTRPSAWKLRVSTVALILALVAGSVIAAGLLIWAPWNASPTPLGLVTGTRSQHLFDGVDVKGWQISDGLWIACRDVEGGQILAGQGRARHGLPAYEHYRVTIGIDLHEASAGELQFGFRGADGGATRYALRLTPSGAVLGRRATDRGPLTAPSPELHLTSAAGSGGYHELRVERQGGHWWAYCDGSLVASVPALASAEAPLIQLVTEGGGRAHFADMEVTELVSPSSLSKK